MRPLTVARRTAPARFGPQAIRTTDYLPHDGMRTAYLANRVVLEALGGIAWRARGALGLKNRQSSDPLLDR